MNQPIRSIDHISLVPVSDSLVEAHASSTQAATTQGLWPFALFIHEEFDEHTALTWGCATRDAREDAKTAGANNTNIKELDDEDISILDCDTEKGFSIM